MKVDAVLVVGVRVGEVVGEARDRGEFVIGGLIQVGVAGAGIDRSVPEAEIGKVGRIVCPTGISPVTYVMKLSTPLFQRRKNCGYRSPTLVTESLMFSVRANGTGPNPGIVSVPVRFPITDVLTPPNTLIRPTEAWPPRTGVANDSLLHPSAKSFTTPARKHYRLLPTGAITDEMRSSKVSHRCRRRRRSSAAALADLAVCSHRS